MIERRLQLSRAHAASALAAGLVRLGVKPGDRVTLYVLNSWAVDRQGLRAPSNRRGDRNPVNVMLMPLKIADVTKDCERKRDL